MRVEIYIHQLQVDLGFPRALWQIGQVLKCVLPAIPSVVVEELKITGFHKVPMYNDRETGPRMRTSRAVYSWRPLRERVTVSTRVFELIKESCPGLKTLVIRNCWLELDHDSHVNLPNGLEKLEFHDCRCETEMPQILFVMPNYYAAKMPYFHNYSNMSH
jgi:hypothetical protein